MEQSILKSVRKVLGFAPDDTSFDEDILMHTNSVFNTLTQLGIGPTDGFSIEDDSVEWDAFIGTDKNLNSVKSYIYLRLRLIFDPPQTSYLIQALNEQRLELESRLNMYREDTAWTDPNTLVV